jgi:hypothetical protein
VLIALARGELPTETDAAQVIKTPIPPIYLRLLITAEPLDDTNRRRSGAHRIRRRTLARA